MFFSRFISRFYLCLPAAMEIKIANYIADKYFKKRNFLYTIQIK